MSVNQVTRMVLGGAVLWAVLVTPVRAQDRPVRERAREFDTQERVEARQARMAERQERRDAFREQNREARLGALAKRLELGDRQIAAVKAAMEGIEPGERAGWQLARLLQRELTAAQKEKLFTGMDRAIAFQRGLRAGARLDDAKGRQGRSSAPNARMGRRAERAQGVRGIPAREGRGVPAVRARMNPGRADAPALGSGARGADSMAEALNLSDTQKELLRIHAALAVGARGGRR